jgi:hypothetical protein
VDHPPQPTLQRFASGTASQMESRTVVAHLLKRCAACARELRSFMEPGLVNGRDYDDALDRFDRELIAALESSVIAARIVRTTVASLLA